MDETQKTTMQGVGSLAHIVQFHLNEIQEWAKLIYGGTKLEEWLSVGVGGKD